MKRSSIGYVTPKGYDAMATMAHRLAKYEGFDAHALSLSASRWCAPDESSD